VKRFWGMQREYGVDDRLVLAVNPYISAQKFVSASGKVKSQRFTVGVGLRQGYLLSPLLSSLVLLASSEEVPMGQQPVWAFPLSALLRHELLGRRQHDNDKQQAASLLCVFVHVTCTDQSAESKAVDSLHYLLEEEIQHLQCKHRGVKKLLQSSSMP